MAAAFKKTCSLMNFTRLYRCNLCAITKFSIESKEELPKNMINTTQVTQQSSLLENIRDKIGHGAALNIIFQEHPTVKYIDLMQWTKYFKLMDLYNFTIQESLLMIRSYPDILKISEEKLNRSLELWYNVILKNEFAKIVILYNPQFLVLEPKRVKQRLGLIHSLASGDKRSIVVSLLRCPNIMFESSQAVTDKFNFLLENWRYEPKEVLRCSALSKSRDFLQLRLSLLEKCGVFRMPYLYPWKKKKAETMKHDNPKLYKICDWNDKDFAEKIASISLEEYQVYSELFEETLELHSDDDEVFDYDSTDL